MRVLANQATVEKPFQSKQWDSDSHVFNSQSSDAHPHHTFLPHTAYRTPPLRMSQVHHNPSDHSSEAQFQILSHCPHRKIVSTSTPYSSLSRSENLRNSELPRGGRWSPISSPDVPGKDTLGGVGMSRFVLSHLTPSPLSGLPLICIYPCRNPLRFLYYSRVETDT